MRSKSNTPIILCALVAWLGAAIYTVSTGSSTVLAQASADRVDVQSHKNFKATVDSVVTALKKEGLMVVATIDHQNMLKMVGTSIKGSKTIEFGKPDMGKMLLPMAPQVGLEMPGKIYIWERSDGSTVVSYRKVAPLYASYGNEQISGAGTMMDMMVEKLVSEATK